MAAWPVKYEKCGNCGCSDEYRPYGRRGYCSKCFYLVKLIEKVKAWDRSRPETLRDMIPANDFSEEEFEVVRKDYIRQAKNRLRCLHVRQMRRNGGLAVEPLDIEHKLGKLLSFTGRRKAHYPQHATYIGKHFDAEQRRVLYTLLDDIEEHLPWKSFSRADAWDAVRKTRGAN